MFKAKAKNLCLGSKLVVSLKINDYCTNLSTIDIKYETFSN